MVKRKSGYIYIMQSGKRNKYKIGKSYNTFYRKDTLQTGTPDDLKIIFMLYFEELEGIEISIHDEFKEYRIKGEWFKFTLNILNKCIGYITRLLEINNLHKLNQDEYKITINKYIYIINKNNDYDELQRDILEDKIVIDNVSNDIVLYFNERLAKIKTINDEEEKIEQSIILSQMMSKIK